MIDANQPAGTCTPPGLCKIRLKVEMVLDREGIVVASYMDLPWAAFGLTPQSTVAGCTIAHLTVARSWHDSGEGRRDLVSITLAHADEVHRIGEREVWLEGVSPNGFFGTST